VLVALKGVQPKADEPSWWKPGSEMMNFLADPSLFLGFIELSFHFPVSEVAGSILKKLN